MLGVRGEELAQQKTSICYRGHTTQIIEPKIGFLIENLIYIDSILLSQQLYLEEKNENNEARLGFTM